MLGKWRAASGHNNLGGSNGQTVLWGLTSEDSVKRLVGFSHSVCGGGWAQSLGYPMNVGPTSNPRAVLFTWWRGGLVILPLGDI